MSLHRPSLAGLPDDVIAYIEELEARLESGALARERREERDETPLEPDEPPTTANVISISRNGLAKRTPRHLYSRQRRSGMGVFDLDSPEEDPPAFLLVADESATLITVTTHGRAFRLAVREIAETPVRGRGQSITDKLPMRPDERLALVVPDQAGAFLCIVSERGQVRRIGSQFLGKNLSSGSVIHDPKNGGRPVAACWSGGNDELLITTRQGRAIRFAERLIPVHGCLGLRVEPDDGVSGAAAAPAAGSIFLLAADGKGTVRAVEGFAANKAPGSGGKNLMKTDELLAALAVGDDSDIFILSRLGKIIRFRAEEVPPKEGVVQGVNCMALRADQCVAATACTVARAPAAE